MKEKKEVFCGLEHFMKYGCVGCKLSRKCEEYYDRVKRDRVNTNSNSHINIDDKKYKELNKNGKTSID